LGGRRFVWGFFYKSLENVHAAQARSTVRGPPGPTIIILKEMIRFNNNHLTRGTLRLLPTRGSSWRGLHSPLRGGYSQCKESPVLPIPSYPALCREDTTSWIHGRSGTPPELQHNLQFYKGYAASQSLSSFIRFSLLCKVYLDAACAHTSL
jgi:hypothetical protein